MRKMLLLLLFSIIYSMVHGQAGVLDQTFGNKGVLRTDLSDNFYGGSALHAIEQKDGKIVLLFRSNGGHWLSRYFSNGTPDPSFPFNHFNHRFYNLGLGTELPQDMILQQDGKIVVAGSSTFAADSDFYVYRIDANGDFSTASSDNTVITPHHQNMAYAVAQQPDGKIVQVGTTFTGTHWDFAVVRYKADLTLDSSFSSNGILTTDFFSGDDVALSVVIQKDGKILVGGYTTPSGSTKKDFALVRYNSNGTLDLSFSGDGKLTTDFSASDDVLKDLAVQSDGRIVAGGTSTHTNTDFAFARYTETGVLDNTFSSDGKLTLNLQSGSSDTLQSIALESDGKILAGGYSRSSGNSDFALVRLTTSGTLDSSFQGVGIDIIDMGTSWDIANKMTLLQDGRILIAGRTGNIQTKLIVARFTPSGVPDKTMQGNGKFTDYLRSYSGYNALAIQKDGKIIAGGYTLDVQAFDGSGNDVDIALARYQINGQLDNSFGNNGIQKRGLYNAYSGQASSIVIQNDGKFVVAGTAATNEATGPADFVILRYNKDGSLDTSFSSGLPFSEDPGDPYYNKGLFYIDFEGEAGDYATSVTLQPDGKIIVSGISKNYDFSSKLALVRLLPGGSMDNSFGIGGKKTIPIFGNVDNAVSVSDGGGTFAIQTDKKILITEWTKLSVYVDSIPSTEEKYLVGIIRLLSNGSVDSSFGNAGLQTLDFAQSIQAIMLQPDGRIVVTTGPGHTLARLMRDGSLDTSFAHKGWITTTFPTASNEEFTNLVLQSDGKIIAGGTYKGAFALARYNSNGTLDAAFGDKGLQISPTISSKGFPEADNQGSPLTAMQIKENRLYAAGWSLNKGDMMATLAAYNLAMGTFTYYRDVDRDGYGNSAKSIRSEKQPWGYVLQAGDCNDNNATVYPGAPEICDGLDNNCNGVVDEGLAQKTFYRDYDFDGYGDARLTTKACAAPPGYASKAGDCHNGDKSIYPGAPELCDGKDNNCNGLVDEACPMVALNERNEFNVSGVQVQVSPNPSTQTFSLQFSSKEIKLLDIRIMDAEGRMIEQRKNIPANGTIALGATYRPGLYIAEIRQGDKTMNIKLVKQAP